MPKPSPLKPTQDAAVALALAATAMPFAGSKDDEAERWLRVLRLHGRVGELLQGLGVPEGPLENRAEPRPDDGSGTAVERMRGVERYACRFARSRNSSTVATFDLLYGVLSVYGSAFDRALYVRGTSRDELLERLGARVAAPTG